jgi:hypothetical protein
MSDVLGFVHELGEELLGTRYLPMRGVVEAYFRANPERVKWLEARIRAYGEVRP